VVPDRAGRGGKGGPLDRGQIPAGEERSGGDPRPGPRARRPQQRLRRRALNLLELRDATVVLGGARILDRLTLTLPVGQHAAILGPNGAGKSTFIKLLTLQLYPVAAE